MNDTLKEFVNILSGKFDNKEQYDKFQKEGKDFPFAKHINTPCNDKIKNLPDDFDGIFILEESYYTVNGRTNPMPHLFLFTMEDDKVKLTSYDMPKDYDKNTFTYENLKEIDYKELTKSEKFTPALYSYKDGVWEGGSESMFTPVLKFTLFERFKEGVLEVSETMEMNGKRTFGYDDAIIYKQNK